MGTPKNDPFNGRLLLTIDDVAEAMSLSKQTIYNQLSRDVFPLRVKKVGRQVRFRTKDLLRYIDEP
jgi:excisionase family DNA binding protein